jgi:hypothetical protein
MVMAVILIGAGLLFELLVVASAPLGYQDETGFHVGAERAGSDDARPS